MATLTGYLTVNARTGAVQAHPGKFNEHDLRDIAAREAPVDGVVEVWLPYHNSAFGDGALITRRVSGKRMRADAEALSGAHTTNRDLARALDDLWYCHAKSWDCTTETADMLTGTFELVYDLQRDA